MSETQALSHLSWVQIHPLATIIGVAIISLTILSLITIPLDKKFKFNSRTSLATAFVLAVVWVVIMIITSYAVVPSKTQIDILRQSPVSVTSTETVQLVSAQSAAYSKMDINHSTFYLNANSSDTTSYRYFVKTTNGDYQVKTLSDSYGNVNSNDVYIHQQNNKPSTLVIKHLQYSNKTVRDILSTFSFWSPKWSTYTFNVPENSITKTSNFK